MSAAQQQYYRRSTDPENQAAPVRGKSRIAEPEEQAPASAASRGSPPSSPRSASMLEGMVDDANVTKMRHRCVVMALTFIAALCIGAIVALIMLLADREPRENQPSTISPNAPPSTAAPGVPTASPTVAPTSSGQDLRLEQFIQAFLVPRLGVDPTVSGLDDPNSPQSQAAAFIAGPDEIADTLPSADHVGDRYALAVLYEATGGDGWLQCSAGDVTCSQGSAWMNTTASHCDWFSIECNDDGRVTSVFFAETEGNGLRGEIPRDLPIMMTGLENFVAVNDQLTGSIPDEFNSLTSLRRLILSSNQLSGVLQEGFLAAAAPLEILLLNNNQFSGALPLSLGQLPALRQLLLSDNDFSGVIPDTLGNLPNLATLDLSNNALLRGEVPTSIFGISTLENLFLNGNTGLEGTLGSSIGGLDSLVSLRLADTGFGMTLPAELFELENLQELDLSGCEFSGTLSSSFGNLANTLMILNLENNLFSGPISPAFGALTRLDVLELEGNELTGEMPAEVCTLLDFELEVLTADCAEVTCSCCTNCPIV